MATVTVAAASTRVPFLHPVGGVARRLSRTRPSIYPRQGFLCYRVEQVILMLQIISLRRAVRDSRHRHIDNGHVPFIGTRGAGVGRQGRYAATRKPPPVDLVESRSELAVRRARWLAPKRRGVEVSKLSTPKIDNRRDRAAFHRVLHLDGLGGLGDDFALERHLHATLAGFRVAPKSLPNNFVSIVLTPKENAVMSQSHLTIDFPIRRPLASRR